MSSRSRGRAPRNPGRLNLQNVDDVVSSQRRCPKPYTFTLAALQLRSSNHFSPLNDLLSSTAWNFSMPRHFSTW